MLSLKNLKEFEMNDSHLNLLFLKDYNIIKIFLFFIFTGSITLSSCFSNQNKYKGDKLCAIIKKMNEDDQKYRDIVANNDHFFAILDSIKESEGISSADYADLPEKTQLEYGKKAREIANKMKKKYSDNYVDSLMLLQRELDNKNTELLIDIVRTRGWPNRTNCNCEEFPAVIFRHSQPKYWDEISKIIELEFKEKRMNSAEYGFYKNHINGRKSTSGRKNKKQNEKKSISF